MITASVGIPSSGPKAAYIQIVGANAYPTGALAYLYYTTPGIELAPSSVRLPDMVTYKFDINGPNVTVTGYPSTAQSGSATQQYVLIAGDNLLVSISARQVKLGPGLAAIDVLIADGGAVTRTATFVEGSVTTTDPNATESTWTENGQTEWNVNFSVDLT